MHQKEFCVLGSLLQSSPEQILGIRCSNKTDVYSMGVVLWELITGAPPNHVSCRRIAVCGTCCVFLLLMSSSASLATAQRRPLLLPHAQPGQAAKALRRAMCVPCSAGEVPLRGLLRALKAPEDCPEVTEHFFKRWPKPLGTADDLLVLYLVLSLLLPSSSISTSCMACLLLSPSLSHLPAQTQPFPNGVYLAYI